MKHFFNTLLLTVSFALNSPVIFADQQPLTELKTFLSKTKTLSANFKQILFDELGKAKQTSQGQFYLSRPGLFRWHYQQPFTQDIVANGGKVWFYDPDLEQVTIKKLDQSMGATPALLLTGEVVLEQQFTIEKQGQDQNIQWLKLIPKGSDNHFKYVLIGLVNGQLAGMELSDNFGQLTRIYFSELKPNVSIAADIFKLNLPAKVDILEDK